MLVSLFLLIPAALGGLALSYLFERRAILSTRLCIGHVVGSALFGTLGFAVSLSLGDLTAGASAAALAASALPALLFLRASVRNAFLGDLRAASKALEGFTGRKALRAGFYISFAVLFLFFFERAMIVRPDGIFTGASQNYGDLPAHLGAIFAFTDGGAFPPENPSFAHAKFTYPFLLDFLTAMLAMLGAGVREAMYVQNVSLAMCLLVMLERFVERLTGNQTAGKLACAIFFFSGGLGFAAFFAEWTESARGLWQMLGDLGRDFTIGKNFRWGNPLVVLFITQRGFLLGMPLTLIGLIKAWEIFTSERTDGDGATGPAILCGLLVGMLPLIHVHSLAALFIVCAVLFLFGLRTRWRSWAAFAAGVSAVAVPELAWVMTGSASNFGKFIELQAGWEYSGGGVAAFWARNTGVMVPVVMFGLGAAAAFSLSGGRAKRLAAALKDDGGLRYGVPLLAYFIPFALIFLLCNFVKLAPWGWDNIKVLIYSFIGALPFMAAALMILWKRGGAGRAAAALLFGALTLSGALDVWRVASGQIEFSVFERDAVDIAADIRSKTEPDGLFLNAPTHNSPMVLTGRRSYMRHPGHLFSYGIDGEEREAETKAIYRGTPAADMLIGRLGLDYVLIGPQERSLPGFNEAYFAEFPVVAKRGKHTVYKVR